MRQQRVRKLIKVRSHALIQLVFCFILMNALLLEACALFDYQKNE
jgi:hypothetical protein